MSLWDYTIMSKRRREAQKQRHDQELADLRSKVEKLQAEVNIELGRANHYRDQWQSAAQTIDQIKKLIDEAYATIRSLHQARWSEHDGFYTLDAALAKMTQTLNEKELLLHCD